MHQFLKHILAFLLLQALIFLCMLWRLHFSSDNYIYGLIDKDALLDTTPSSRVLLVGGSNLAFGVDSGALKERWDINVVNLGLYAPLGLDYMLNQALSGLASGDVVVLSLEYELFGMANEQRGRTNYWSELMLVHPRTLTHVPPDSILHTLARTPDQLNVIAGLTKDSVRLDRAKGDYSRAALNSYGDHATLKVRDLRSFPMKHSRFEFKEDLYKYALERLVAFRSECEARGARVCMVMPVIIDRDYPAIRDELAQLEQRLAQDSGIPILLNCHESQMPIEMFYDTNYHLNTKGVEHRTRVLARHLAPFVRPEAGTSAQLP